MLGGTFARYTLPEQYVRLTQPGLRMLFLTGYGRHSEAPDKEFIQAAALAYEYMRKNLRTPGPSLSPWLVFVGEPPRDPERYNLLHSTPLASIAIQARSVPLALGIAPLHQRGITRWRVRLRPRTQARLSCMRGPAVGP